MHGTSIVVHGTFFANSKVHTFYAGEAGYDISASG